MGLPGFTTYILKKEAEYRLKVITAAIPTAVNECYIDYNGLIHNALGNEPAGCSNSYYASIVIHELDRLISHIKPKSLCGIYIDGVGTLAKIQQQRIRRYINGYSSTNYTFDRANISPGTLFMNTLIEKTSDYVRSSNNNHSIYIDYGPGEAEHRIVDYLKSSTVSREYSSTILIVAGDRDYLHLLSPLVNYTSLYFMVNKKDTDACKTNYSTDVEYYNILEFRMMICRLLGRDIDKVYESACDMIALFSLIGNDFVPKSPSISYNSIDTVFSYYRSIRRPLVDYSTGRLDQWILLDLISLLAKDELTRIRAIKPSTRLGTSTVPNVDFASSNYAKDYNELKLGIKSDMDMIICVKNLLGIASWYTQLYTIGLDTRYRQLAKYRNRFIVTSADYTYVAPDVHTGAGWMYRYNYHYAPLLTEIVRIRAKYYIPKYIQTTFLVTEPLHHIVQLMMIMNPERINTMLGSRFYDLTQKNLKEYYPDRNCILVDNQLAEDKEWKSVICLPSIDLNVLLKELHQLGVGF